MAKAGLERSGSQLIRCRADGCPSGGRKFTPAPKRAGRKKAEKTRERAAVSLWPEVWRLIEEIGGGVRRTGIEEIAAYWKENHK